MPKKLPFKEFKKIYSKVPRMCVEIVIKSSKGVLLTLRDIPPWKGMWHLPGGTVLYDETLEQTAKRVALEELDLNIKVDCLLGLNEYMPSKFTKDHSLAAIFLVKVDSGVIKLNEQSSDVRYFKEIPQNTIKEHKQFLEKMN